MGPQAWSAVSVSPHPGRNTTGTSPWSSWWACCAASPRAWSTSQTWATSTETWPPATSWSTATWCARSPTSACPACWRTTPRPPTPPAWVRTGGVGGAGGRGIGGTRPLGALRPCDGGGPEGGRTGPAGWMGHRAPRRPMRATAVVKFNPRARAAHASPASSPRRFSARRESGRAGAARGLREMALCDWPLHRRKRAGKAAISQHCALLRCRRVAGKHMLTKTEKHRYTRETKETTAGA